MSVTRMLVQMEKRVAALVVGSTIGIFAIVGAGESPAQSGVTLGPSLSSQLERFRLEGRATVEVSEGSGQNRRLRDYRYVIVTDGRRYRIEVTSKGAEIGVHPRTSIAFDGKQTWLVIPYSDTLTVRTGDFPGPLPVAIPDPLLLQFRALASLESPDSARLLSIRDLSRGDPLVSRLERLAQRQGALAASKSPFGTSPTRLQLSGGVEAEVHWRQEGLRWVPVRYSAGGLWGGGGSVEWTVGEFFPAAEAGGVSGIPRQLDYRASDTNEGPTSQIRISYEVLSFRVGIHPIERGWFTLEPDSASGPIWDEDAEMFLRSW